MARLNSNHSNDGQYLLYAPSARFCIHLLSALQEPVAIGTYLIPVLQMRTLRHREVKQLAHNHTARNTGPKSKPGKVLQNLLPLRFFSLTLHSEYFSKMPFPFWDLCFHCVEIYITFIILVSFFLPSPHGTWDLSSLTRDHTCTPTLEALSLNPWTARDVPILAIFKYMVQRHQIYSYVMQPSPPSVTTSFSSSPKQILSPVNTNSPFLLLQSLAATRLLSVYKSDHFRYLI